MNLKKALVYFLATAFTGISLSSCVDNTIEPITYDYEGIPVSYNITSNTTWETGNTYILEGRIAVTSGATLTIEPGVIVKGALGAETNAAALVIARGSKIMAEGTSESPIIFTTVVDEIQPGQIVSPNLLPSKSASWGGIIVLGNAPISADASSVQIEGIPPSDQNGLYGGSEPNDNSGVMKYISIRHGGTNIGSGNEINGLTLAGVGAGTEISHIEIIGNQDDGLECFGGTVNLSNILVWNAGDDSFDMDQAYSGTLNNFIGILGSESDHALELDGPEGAGTGFFTLINGSIKGALDAKGGEYADLRADVTCTLENIYFFNFKGNSDFELDNEAVAENWINGEIILKGLEFNTSHLTEGNLDLDAIFEDKSKSTNRDSDLNIASQGFATLVEAPTVGADKTPFLNWTWADADKQLDSF